MKKLIITIILIVTTATAAWAASSKTGTTTATFLKIETGGRPTAMGGAFAAVSDDLNAMYYNPAGLAQLNSRAFSAVHTVWLEKIYHDYAAFASPVRMADKDMTLGLNIVYLGIADIDRRTSAGVADGSANVSDYAVGGTLAWKLRDTTSIGATVKGIRMDLDKSSNSGFAVDAGILEKLPHNMSLGLMIQNLGPNIDVGGTNEKLPTNFKAGIAYRLLESKLLLASDIDFPNDRDLRFHAGGEYRFSKMFALRAGYEGVDSPGNSSGLTAGISVSEDSVDEILNVNLVFDYAWMYFGELGSTHRIEIGIKF